MPIHDWTRVSAGTFHDLHVSWIGGLRTALNGGLLPEGYYAQAEQVAGPAVPDVLTLQLPDDSATKAHAIFDDSGGGTATLTMPPKLAVTDTLKLPTTPTPPQRRITIRHASDDRVIAFLELVSPANKDRPGSIEQFADKAVVAFSEGLHLQIIDLFPPGKFDPQGLHSLIWSRLEGNRYQPPAGKPLTLAAYNAATATCYVEPTAVGQLMIDTPLFLTREVYVNVPLEQTYMAAYHGVPRRWKQVIEAAV